jgi:hypothetical protein
MEVRSYSIEFIPAKILRSADREFGDGVQRAADGEWT